MTTDDGIFKPCLRCFEGFKLDGQPKGTMERLGGLEYYFSPGNGTDKSKGILVGPDLFGLAINNPKILADWFADKTGLDCFVPDYFEGDRLDVSTMKPQLDLLDQQMNNKPWYSRWYTLASVLYGFVFKVGPTYLRKHSIPHTTALSDKFCRDLKAEKGYKRLGWTGYCFGAALAVLLSKEDGPIDVAVGAHPGRIPAADMEAIRKPFAVICAEEDLGFDAVKEASIAILNRLEKEQGVPVAIYDDHPGTTHGFGSRPNLSDPKVKDSFEKSLVETKEWFDKHL
ncbi:hypothetical protein JCM6882_000693 [Rhodosporidiobolus microsporus]